MCEDSSSWPGVCCDNPCSRLPVCRQAPPHSSISLPSRSFEHRGTGRATCRQPMSNEQQGFIHPLAIGEVELGESDRKREDVSRAREWHDFERRKEYPGQDLRRRRLRGVCRVERCCPLNLRQLALCQTDGGGGSLDGGDPPCNNFARCAF